MVRVFFFASLKDLVGSDWIQLELIGERTVAQIFNECITRFPELATHRASTRAAVNEAYADWDTVVHDGDEIAFFPPVSGG